MGFKSDIKLISTEEVGSAQRKLVLYGLCSKKVKGEWIVLMVLVLSEGV